jgi:hypothetical protein
MVNRVHSFCRRQEKPPGRPLRHGVCRMPSGVCGREFYNSMKMKKFQIVQEWWVRGIKT